MGIGSILVNQQFAVPVTLYDTEKLQADLSAGVANVMAGVGGAHILDIDTGQGFALFRHTSAVYDAPAGAGYTGDLRCALGITSNGLMAGFNRKSDGAWVNSLVIDATTGSATFTGAINAESGNFTGTVKAGSIITGSVTIAGVSGNTTLDDIIAASGSYTTSDLEADLAAGVGAIVAGTGSDYRLTVDPANGFIVAGRNGSVFKGTAATGVNRPALGISANGIAMGYNRSSDGLWVDGVAIDASGKASFSGAINATSGNFTGTVTAGSFVSRNAVVGQSSTNLMLWSEQFYNTTWVVWNGDIAPDEIIAPDGSITADILTPTDENALVAQPIGVDSNSQYTFSVYLKSEADTKISLVMYSTPGWSLISAKEVSITTEWMRFSISGTTLSDTTLLRCYIGGLNSYSIGDPPIHMWGAQLETGSTATDYIKTESTAVTKEAKTLDQIATGATGYTTTNLQSDLTTGVGKILAGVGSNYRMNVDTSASAITMGHKDALYGVSTGAYATELRTALAITANGIAMGYNRKSDGAWVNSIAIDSSGNASFSGAINATSGNFTGTVTAGSIITSSVTVDGTTLATIKSGAAAGATALQSGALANLIDRTATTTLTGVINPSSSGAIKVGSITWNTSTGAWVSGTGFAITDKGIIASAGGGYTLSISSSGSAMFKGNITGSDGAFAGTVSASNITAGTITASVSINSAGSINATGVYGSAVGNASVVGAPSTTGNIGVVGASGTNAGVYGRATGATSTSVGVYGEATNAAGYGVYGSGTGTGIAVFAGGSGRIAVGGTNVQLRQVSGVLRATDTYTTDANLIMGSAIGAGSGATATLGPVIGTSTAMAGWITGMYGSIPVRIPYWPL